MALKLIIELKTALHHGSGFGLAGIVDRAVLRDHRGMPYLAGSALKGKLRYAAHRYLLASKVGACGPPKPWCETEKGCLFCEIFGSPRRQGKAVFEDAYPRPCAEPVLRAQMEEEGAAVLPGGTAHIGRSATGIGPRPSTAGTRFVRIPTTSGL